MDLKSFMAEGFSLGSADQIDVMYLKTSTRISTLDVLSMSNAGKSNDQIIAAIDDAIALHEDRFDKGFGTKTLFAEILYRDGGQALVDDYDGNEFWQLTPGGDRRQRMFDKIQDIKGDIQHLIDSRSSDG